ncbi:hypothetical protein V3H40_25505 [Vibrio parahaemolyticus]|uniref:hypothetical protein n=1 Tax=Vibrio parahaemolyticus TaxID=670 RepID=UPI00387B3BAB
MRKNKIFWGLSALCLSMPIAASSADKLLLEANSKLALSYSPYRLAEVETTDSKSVFGQIMGGTPGQTIAVVDKLVLKDVLDSFHQMCGYQPSQVTAINVVSHMDNGKSALSLVLKALPNNGGTDIDIYGDCHPKPLSFTNLK